MLINLLFQGDPFLGVKILFSMLIIQILQMGMVGIEKMRNAWSATIEQGLHLERKGIISVCKSSSDEMPDLLENIWCTPESQFEFLSTCQEIPAIEPDGRETVDQNDIRSFHHQHIYVYQIDIMIRKLISDHSLHDLVGKRPGLEADES